MPFSSQKVHFLRRFYFPLSLPELPDSPIKGGAAQAGTAKGISQVDFPPLPGRHNDFKVLRRSSPTVF
jgi:hypothetical protein